MKKLSYLFIPGVIILFICLFLPIEKICDYEKENGEMAYIQIKGIFSITYLIGTFFVAIAILISLFSRGKEAKIGLIVISVSYVFAFIILGFISTAGFGRPCGSSADDFFFLMLITQILLFYISFLQLAQKNKTSDSDSDF